MHDMTYSCVVWQSNMLDSVGGTARGGRGELIDGSSAAATPKYVCVRSVCVSERESMCVCAREIDGSSASVTPRCVCERSVCV